eukprot:1994591-Prymnesium_polylepis.1
MIAVSRWRVGNTITPGLRVARWEPAPGPIPHNATMVKSQSAMNKAIKRRCATGHQLHRRDRRADS